MLDEVDDAALVLVRDLLLACSARSSTKTISRPLLRNAIVCRRSSTVRATNSVPSATKIVGSGQNVTVVPVRRDRAPASAPTTSQLALRLAALGVLLAVALAVAVDLDDQPLATAR